MTGTKVMAYTLGAVLFFMLGYWLGYGILDQQVYNRYNAYLEEVASGDSTIQPVKIESWESQRKYNEEYSFYRAYKPEKGSSVVFHYLVDKYGKEHLLVTNVSGGIIEVQLNNNER